MIDSICVNVKIDPVEVDGKHKVVFTYNQGQTIENDELSKAELKELLGIEYYEFFDYNKMMEFDIDPIFHAFFVERNRGAKKDILTDY